MNKSDYIDQKIISISKLNQETTGFDLALSLDYAHQKVFKQQGFKHPFFKSVGAFMVADWIKSIFRFLSGDKG